MHPALRQVDPDAGFPRALPALQLEGDEGHWGERNVVGYRLTVVGRIRTAPLPTTDNREPKTVISSRHAGPDGDHAAHRGPRVELRRDAGRAPVDLDALDLVRGHFVQVAQEGDAVQEVLDVAR